MHVTCFPDGDGDHTSTFALLFTTIEKKKQKKQKTCWFRCNDIQNINTT